MHTLTLQQLRTAVDVGDLSIVVKAEGSVFFIQIITPKTTAILAKARSTEPRSFGNPFQAMALLHEVGITQGTYDMSEYSAQVGGSSARSRPDRQEALKHAHEAVAYDKWFREQVQAGLKEMNDPDTQGIPHEVIKEKLLRARDRIQARIDSDEQICK